MGYRGQSMLSPSIPIFLMCALVAISGCIPSPSSSPIPVKAGVVTQISYSPTLVPITITLDSDCQISVKFGNKIVTPIGVFEHSIAAKMKPDIGKIYVVISRGSGTDAVYELMAGSHLEFDPAQLVKGMRLKSPDHIVLIIPQCLPAPDRSEDIVLAPAPVPEPAIVHAPVPSEVPREQIPSPQIYTPEPFRQPEKRSSPEPKMSSPIQKEQPATSTRAMSLHNCANQFKPRPGSHFARIIHPTTGIEYQISFSLPPGTPNVVERRNKLLFQYPNQTVEFDFKKNGRLDIDYR